MHILIRLTGQILDQLDSCRETLNGSLIQGLISAASAQTERLSRLHSLLVAFCCQTERERKRAPLIAIVFRVKNSIPFGRASLCSGGSMQSYVVLCYFN